MINNKRNKLLAIVLLILGIGMIGTGTIFMITDPNYNAKKDNHDKVNGWKKYDQVDHYELSLLEATNLSDIEVKLDKISFETGNGTKGTLDFSKSSYVPSYFSMTGFEGFIYMRLSEEFDLESWQKEHLNGDASIFNDVLTDGQEIKFYTADKSHTYANVLLQVGNSYWVLGVNIESTPIDDAVGIFKQLIPLAVEYDNNAPTIEEFTNNVVRQIKFNVEEISLENINTQGTGLMYKNTSNGIRVSSLGTVLSNSYTRIKDDYVSLEIPIVLPSRNDKFDDVLQKEIKGIPIRVYRNTQSDKDVMDNTVENYIYKVGLIENDREYLLDVYYKSNSKGEIDEQKILDFLHKIIK
jgi:hypothetical protein